MNNKMGEAIRNFIGNGSHDFQREVETLLWNEIIETVKGQKTSKFMGCVFTFQFPKDCEDQPNSLPDEIEFHGIRKDFSEALEALFREMLLKTKEKHEGTIGALKGSEDDRKKWIRGTLRMVLVNKVFNKEIQDWRSLEARVDRRIEAWKRTDDWENIELGQREEAETRKREEIRETIDSPKGITVVPLEVKKEGREGRYFEDRQDTLSLKEFWEQHFEDLKDEGPTVDTIEWQHEAFFWRPGEELQGKTLTGKKSDRGVYLAFFYSWLRRCSHASFDEIAEETDVATTTVSRDWKPHADLEEPFPDPFDDTVGWLDEIFEYPVYFHSDARASIGMYDSKISRYRRKDYNEQGKYYPPILRRKEILWNIYGLLLDPEKIRGIQNYYDRKVSLDFSCEVVAGSDIGIPGRKTPSPFVHITTIGVDDA